MNQKDIPAVLPHSSAAIRAFLDFTYLHYIEHTNDIVIDFNST